MSRPVLGLALVSSLVLFSLGLATDAQAASRQFNTFTAATDQPLARNPAVRTLEDCPSCRPPTHAEPVLNRGCATCPKAKLPPPLAGDCKNCSHGDAKPSRPSTTPARTASPSSSTPGSAGAWTATGPARAWT